MRRKVGSSSSEAKLESFDLEQKGGSFSFKPMGKEDKWTIVLCVGGENRAADLNFYEKRPRGPGLSKQFCPALTPSIESCRIQKKPP